MCRLRALCANVWYPFHWSKLERNESWTLLITCVAQFALLFRSLIIKCNQKQQPRLSPPANKNFFIEGASPTLLYCICTQHQSSIFNMAGSVSISSVHVYFFLLIIIYKDKVVCSRFGYQRQHRCQDSHRCFKSLGCVRLVSFTGSTPVCGVFFSPRTSVCR